MFDTLTDELLDLSIAVKGPRTSAFAFVLTCCSSCCSCGARVGDD
jgi:hypothetical protein